MTSPAAGWNPDPTGRHEYRYWDGTTWTDDVSDEGVTSVDPVGGPAPTGGEPTAAMDPTQQYSPQPGEPGGPPPGGYGQQPGYGPQPGPYGQQQPGQPPSGHGAQAGGYGSPPGGYDPSYGSGQVPPGPPRKSGPSTGLIVGLAILALALIAGLVFFLTRGGDDDTATSDETTTTEDTAHTTEGTSDTTEDTGPTDADVFSLEVGDCLADDTQEDEVQEVPVVPCDQPHISEIFHSYMIEADSLPGADEMETIVTEQCLPAFETFVGLPYEDSVLQVTWLEPTSGSWDAGDRELLCMVVDPAGEITGSVQGAGR